MIQRTADTIRSSFQVHAQTPQVKKPTFNEDVSLQFFIAQDYTMTVEGVIELTNASGKDISLTQYDMNLPYFTLKDTKIGYIYPQAFLVDMYSENNSILFTFKSQFTKPVVIGKNGKITFTFSAQVDRPYRDMGGLRTLSFPFTLTEAGRVARITVTTNEKLPIVFSPKVVTQLKGKNIFPVSDESGKLFIFATSIKPIGASFSHSTEVSLPTVGKESQCVMYEPVSCIGCGTMTVDDSTGNTSAQRSKESLKVTTQLLRTVSPTCAIQKYSTMDTKKWKAGPFKAGYLISAASAQLIPASWRSMLQDGNEYVSNVMTTGIPNNYVDSLGLLTIPIHTCTTDEECIKFATGLQTIDTAVSTAPEFISSGVSRNLSDITYSIKQEGRRFSFIVQNNSDKFFNLDTIILRENSYFGLNDLSSHIINPKSSLTILLDSKKQIQTTNQDTQLVFMLNKEDRLVTFQPIKITILSIIEVLAYIFVVSLGITIVSVLILFLYNKRHETKTTSSN